MTIFAGRSQHKIFTFYSMFTLEEYVTTSRTDESGKLKLVSAVDMMQDCSQLWQRTESVFDKYYKENGLSQLLISRQMDILRMPEFGEKLTISTTVYHCENFHGYRNTIIYDEKHEPCIASWIAGVCVHIETNRLRKMPPEIASSLIFDPKFDMEYLDRKIRIPNEKVTEFNPVRVTYDDIDMNRHMNNAQYIRIAVELLPCDFKVDRLRVEYKMPAKYGAILYPLFIKAEKMYFISLVDENKQPYAIMEFSQL